MNIQIFKNFSFCLLAAIFPATVSAASFFPTADMEINLSDNTTFNFDSYTISSDVSIHYLAPADSLIEIISEGDVTIDGALSFFGGTFSITSVSGSIFVNGEVNILGDLNLVAGTVPDSGAGTITGGGSLMINGGGTLTTTGTGITLIPTGTITVPPGGVTLTLISPVPVPPSLILFLTGLIALSLKLKPNTKTV